MIRRLYRNKQKAFVEILKEVRMLRELNLTGVEDKDAIHNEYCWARRFPNLVLWLFENP